MRKLVFLLLYGVGVGSVPALAQWQPVSNPVNTGIELLAAQIDPIDRQTAWFANSFYFTPPFTVQVSRTTDGGQSWQNVGPAVPGTGRFTIGMLDALDAQHAWVLMQRQDAANNALPPELHHTADGGATWTRRGLPAASTGVARLHFRSLTEGLLLDQQLKTIYRTTDGGQTWTAPISLPALGPNEQLFDLQAAGGLLWTQVYNQWAQPVGFWGSTDGGRSWQRQAVPAGSSWGVVFRDAQHGLLPTAAGGLLATADGGLTWTTATAPPFQLDYQVALTAVPGSTAYVAGAFMHSYPNSAVAKGSAVSTDDGRTWTPLESTHAYQTIRFAGPDAGWAIQADFFGPTVQYMYRGLGRYTGAVLAQQPRRPLLPAEVFPNPSADGRFVVRLPGAEAPGPVRVLDALGRAVYHAPTLPADQRLDLSRLPKGLYSLEVQTTAGVVRHRLLRE